MYLAASIPLSRNALTIETTPVTAPLPPVLPSAEPVAAPPYVAPSGSVRFPLGWMLRNGSPPLQYRATMEVARLFDAPPPSVAALPLHGRTALLLAASQSLDGGWSRSMLSVPAAPGSIEGVGLIVGFRRLLESGWDKDAPPLARARRLLFRLLAEDEDPNYLYEYSPQATDDTMVRYGRRVLREAAAAVLAQAGYEADPRLRGAARRILDRLVDYFRSPLSQKPWTRIGNKHVLAADAMPPSIFTIAMLAHMPLFRSELNDVVERLYQHLVLSMPRQEPVQLIGEHMIDQPYLILGDPLHSRHVFDSDPGFGFVWLELMARLGFLRRHEGWSVLFERLLDQRDSDGVWRVAKGETALRSAHPMGWSAFPLQENLEGEGRFTDATFRIGLIARLSGRTIDLT